MIPVAMPAPAPQYHAKVQVPGQAFLAATPHPAGKEWHGKNYWSAIHGTLYSNMKGICSYCATFTPRRPGATSIDHTSIDHFVPKAKEPSLAYEWSNFRLCRARLNHRKGEHEDVLDPYVLGDGWFRLDFTTFLLYPDPNLSEDEKQRVKNTIIRLELNKDDRLVQERLRAVCAYADGQLTPRRLWQFYPFIASEIAAQDFDVVHLPRFRRLLANPKIRSSFGL